MVRIFYKKYWMKELSDEGTDNQKTTTTYPHIMRLESLRNVINPPNNDSDAETGLSWDVPDI